MPFDPIERFVNHIIIDAKSHAHMVLAITSKCDARCDRDSNVLQQSQRKLVGVIVICNYAGKNVVGAIGLNIAKYMPNAVQPFADERATTGEY